MKTEKQFRLRNGWKYENYSIDNGGLYPIHGRYFDELERCWRIIAHSRNLLANSNSSAYDLILISPFDSFKVNDPIMVSCDGETWRRMLFAGVSPEGLPKVFVNGGNSWTSLGYSGTFAFGRKPTDEELI